MLTPHRTPPALLAAVVCALFLGIMSVGVSSAGARPAYEPTRTTYQPVAPPVNGDPPPHTSGVPSSDPMALYYSSFGNQAPISATNGSTPSDDDTPWLAIVLVGAGALVLAGAGAAAVVRVQRTRHSRTALA
jgi:hypothetical protein